MIFDGVLNDNEITWKLKHYKKYDSPKMVILKVKSNARM
jgi:hypothetical protein